MPSCLRPSEGRRRHRPARSRLRPIRRRRRRGGPGLRGLGSSLRGRHRHPRPGGGGPSRQRNLNRPTFRLVAVGRGARRRRSIRPPRKEWRPRAHGPAPCRQPPTLGFQRRGKLSPAAAPPPAVRSSTILFFLLSSRPRFQRPFLLLQKTWPVLVLARSHRDRRGGPARRPSLRPRGPRSGSRSGEWKCARVPRRRRRRGLPRPPAPGFPWRTT